MRQRMKKWDHITTTEDGLKIMNESQYGFLATVGSNGEPYVVALNFIIIGNEILFHCDPNGKKVDNMLYDDLVYFKFVGNTEVTYLDGRASYYASTIVNGRAYEVTNSVKKEKALYQLIKKYFPENMIYAKDLIDRGSGQLHIWAVKIDRKAV